MNSYMHEFLFGFYPYLCIAVFFLGSMLRMDRDPYSWRAKSSQILSKKNFVMASNAFHFGIIFLFFGHMFGLLTPPEVYHALGLDAATKQIIAMTAGGIFGTICFIGLSMLLYRRLTDSRVNATSSFMDIAILVLVYIQLILGLISIYYSGQHPDGQEMLNLANWAQHIVTFRPGAADFIINSGWVFKAHIVFGLTLFLLTPFTRLVHVLSAPMGYLVRTGYQIVRKRS